MGVDYFNCDNCDEIFNDCGPHGYCSACDSRLCGECLEKAVEKYGDGEEEAVDCCQCCDESKVHDWELLPYALKKLKMTKKELIKEIENEKASISTENS